MPIKKYIGTSIFKATKRGRVRKGRTPQGRGRTRPPHGVVKGIAKRLRALIESQYGTRYEFCQATGWAFQTVNGWMSKTSPKVPDSASLLRIAEVTGASMDYLLRGIGPELAGSTRLQAALYSDLRLRLTEDVRAARPDLVSLLPVLYPYDVEYYVTCLQSVLRKLDGLADAKRALEASGRVVQLATGDVSPSIPSEVGDLGVDANGVAGGNPGS